MSAFSLPLFPLNIVVCPGGLLPLRIFEARYLDMVKDCMRNSAMFGLVAALPDEQLSHLPFARIGTAFTIMDADVPSPGLMMIRCCGQHRFQVNSALQQKDGLWVGQVEDIPNDLAMQIPDDLSIARTGLQNVIDSFDEQGIPEAEIPLIKPYQMEDCAWVANRWVELLDLPLIQKQRLLALDSPLVRLELLQDFLLSSNQE